LIVPACASRAGRYLKIVSTASACRIFGKLLTGLFFLPAALVFGGDANVNWLTRSWQSDDGLPDNSVSGVAQTPDGYLWVATAGGLMRFDGVRFQEFSLANLDGVPNRVVRAMVRDEQGSLWLAMDRGVVVCIAKDGTRVFKDGLPDARAIGMAVDVQGAIWITYGNGGVTRIKNGGVTVFDSTSGWPASGDSSLISDVKGQIWFARGNQVGVFHDGKFQTLLTLPGPVWCIGKRQAGGIWICAGQKILKYETGGEAQEFGQFGNGGIEPRTLIEDRHGALWIGTAASGLFRSTGGGLELVPTSYREIICLMEDREGNIWAGTGGGGLDRLRSRVIELLGPETGLPYESIRSICQDASGAIWVATQNGLLACLKSNVWITAAQETNWPGAHFSCVADDAHGGVWIGSRDHGLYHLNGGQLDHLTQQEGLTNNDVRSLLVSSTGDLWIASDSPSRLQRLRNGKLQKLEIPVQTRSLRALAEDAAGNIWVASADGYLLRASGDQVLNATPGATNRLLSIRCLYTTPDGSVWIGYAGWGIGRLKDGKFTRITSEQGLYDDYVSQMIADNQGWLWCAGNHGIFQVQLKQLNDVAEGRTDRVRSVVYGPGEGFPNQQANYENFPGSMRSQDGRLWFPMRTGLAVVHTDNVPNNTAPPPVLLERVAADGETVALYDRRLTENSENPTNVVSLLASPAKLQFPPNHRKLDFEFTALSFTAPENVQFQYRLRGFDENWVEAGTARSASYSRLPPSKYRFDVRACNNDGVWNETGASLNFVVTPFYWQTLWFRLTILITFTVSVIAIVRYVSFRRLRRRLVILEQQAALQKERARIAKDIHDDLGASLTQIAFLGELARQDRGEPEKAAERIGNISTTARHAIKSLDEIVWAVNPRNDTLAHLIDYAGQFAVDYLRLADIRCRLDFPEQSPPRELSTDLRHNLFLAIKEALHNIVKHAQASEVWLRIKFSGPALDIVVEDNGRGFEREPDDALADGLRNMRQRMTDISGECRIESHAGAGTKIILRLPWPDN
jgi:signal transduction histidine kinase/ligand-binding sensor domain-containing protein